jgi:hypothetical protein
MLSFELPTQICEAGQRVAHWLVTHLFCGQYARYSSIRTALIFLQQVRTRKYHSLGWAKFWKPTQKRQATPACLFRPRTIHRPESDHSDPSIEPPHD